MNKSKWIWLGLISLAIIYGVFSGVSRHVKMNRLAHELHSGSPAEQVAAVRELMRRDRLYDKVQELSPEDRVKAMSAVEQLSGEVVVKQTLILLKDADPKVRERVTEVLVKVGEDHLELLVAAMKDSDENVRNGAKAALVTIGPKAIKEVQTAAKAADLRVAAADVLVKIGEPSIPALIELMLEDEDQDVRMAAAGALGRIGSVEATAALIKATEDVRAVRQVAISSLCAICDPKATDTLIEVLAKSEDDGEVRARAARALSVIGGPKATQALADALGDLDLKVRTSVVTGLQRIGVPAVGPVVEAMSSGNKTVRYASAAALEMIDSPEAAATLAKLASDGDPAIRASAARGLGRQSTVISPEVVVPLLEDAEGGVGEVAAITLAKMGSRAIPALVGVLKGSSSGVAKYRAADALSNIGTSSVPALLAVIGSNVETNKWAAHALGRIGDSRAEPALRKLAAASDPDLAYVAKQALERL